MPYHILIVDDDSSLREELREIFGEYTVSEAQHGDQAVTMLRQANDIDLVILDVNMPGSKGTKVLKQLKEINPDLLIVMLTGYSTKDTVLDSWRGCADEFIEKPPNPEKITGIIKTLLEKQEGKSMVNNGHKNLGGLAAKIERVKRLAARNYHRKITLADAARTVFMSPKYLSKVFKETTGTGFSEYKLLVKIDHAKKLLQTTDYTIEEISNRLGYLNTESFIRTFKDLAGFRPTEFRDQAEPAEKKPVTVRKKVNK